MEKFVNKEIVDDYVKKVLKEWIDIAERVEMKYDTIDIREGKKILMEDYKKATLVFFPSGYRTEVLEKTEGTAIFVDFTKSTNYFVKDENYTGFILFNAYNTLIKQYIKEIFPTNGYFLEHTGDGAFLFVKKEEINYIHYLRFLYMSEKLKEYAINKNLLRISEETSLIHIGASYGKGYLVVLETERKFFSMATWDAANNCKNAPREFSPNIFCIPEIDGIWEELWSGNNSNGISDVIKDVLENYTLPLKIS